MTEYLDYPALSAESGLSVREWQRRVAAGDVDVCRVGKRVLVPRASFLRFMESHTTRASKADVREKLRQLAEKALASK